MTLSSKVSTNSFDDPILMRICTLIERQSAE